MDSGRETTWGSIRSAGNRQSPILESEGGHGLKRLLGIGIAGCLGVLSAVLLARLVLGIIQGRPVFHASGVGFVLLRDTVTVLVMVAIIVGYLTLCWLDLV